MSSSAKEDYIRQVLSQVDNFWVRKRLRQELDAHFDDALENLSMSIEDRIEQVKADLGSPEEIAHQANNGHPSFQKAFRKHLNQVVIVSLVLMLVLLGTEIVMLYRSLEQTQADLAQVRNELVSMNHQISKIDDLKSQTDQFLSAEAMMMSLMKKAFGSQELQPVKAVLNPINVTSHDRNITVLQPTMIPIEVSFIGVMPSSIVAREGFGLLSIAIKDGAQLVEFMRFEIMAKDQVKKIRYTNGSVIELKEGDFDYQNGLYLIRTDASSTVLNALSLSQRQDIATFMNNLQWIQIKP